MFLSVQGDHRRCCVQYFDDDKTLPDEVVARRRSLCNEIFQKIYQEFYSETSPPRKKVKNFLKLKPLYKMSALKVKIPRDKEKEEGASTSHKEEGASTSDKEKEEEIGAEQSENKEN